jgi:O-antigen/teichoic acid export membrane protein
MVAVEEQQRVFTELRTALRHTVVYGMGNVLAKVIGFLMLPFYTHYLNPHDYGILEILDLSMSLFGMFLTMGMTAAVLRCYAAANGEGEKKKVISTAFAFVLVTGLITFVIGFTVARSASALIFGPDVPYKYLLISFSAFICTYIVILPRTYLRALEKSGSFTIVDNAALAVMLGLNIYFIAVAKIGLLGILLSGLIVGTGQLLILSTWVVRRAGIGFSSSWLGRMLRFGAPLMLSNIAVFVLNFSDRFFLQHLTGLEVVGLYAVGYKFGYMMNYMVVQPFYVMWQARMYTVHSQPNYEKVFARIFMLYSLVLVYLGLALSTLSPEIVHLMVGAKFFASQTVIPVVVFAYVFWGIGFYTQTGMFLTNNTKLVAVAGALAAVLDLGLNYVLILRYGMMGAAWATLIAFASLAVASYYFSYRVLPLPLRVGRVAAALGIALAIYLLAGAHNFGALGIGIAIKVSLLAAFPVLLWKLRILSPDDLHMIVAFRDHSVAHVSRMVNLVSGKAAA